MEKQETNYSPMKQEPKKAEQEPTTDLSAKTVQAQSRIPFLSDDHRVVFSEEINRDSDLDDG